MKQRLGFLLAVMILCVMPPSVRAQTSDGLTAIITSPTEGQQLFGVLTIVGSAAHTTAFASYTLEYDYQGDTAVEWNLVQDRVTQQVQNGVLGLWDTSTIPDGYYQLRLLVYLTDGQTGEFVVASLHVVNTPPTPLPTSESVSVSPTEPTPGPSPTSPVQQPPGGEESSTILGFSSEENEPAATTTGNEKQTRVNTNRVKSAFCSGVYLTLAAFAIMIGYIVIRGRLRPYARRLVWQDDNTHE
jgi:hypothetical protein